MKIRLTTGRALGFILAIFSFGLNLLWVWAIPPLNAPDEPAHLQAIMEVRKHFVLPEIRYSPGNPTGDVLGSPGDLETRAYAERLFSQRVIDDPYLLIPYEATQPPLYYVAAGLAAQVVPPDPELVLYVARIISALFGAGTVFFAWLAAREIAPQSPMWAIAAAGSIALLPQFCFNSATAGNDSTLHLTATASFYIWFRALRDPNFDRYMLGAGAVLGLALLSKLTAVALIPGLALVILFRLSQPTPNGSRPNWLKRGILLASGAALGISLTCGWWLIRNTFVYGEPTGMEEALHFYKNRFPQLDLSIPESASTLLRETLESTWGRFGWNHIQLPVGWYQTANISAALLVAISILAGLLYSLRRIKDKQPLTMLWQPTAIFIAVALTLYTAYIRFNETVAYQAQGRYFFILLLPAALLLTGGVYTLAPTRLLKVALLGLLLTLLASFNALTWFIVNSVR